MVKKMTSKSESGISASLRQVEIRGLMNGAQATVTPTAEKIIWRDSGYQPTVARGYIS
jgi:hypothetical protein